MRPWAYQLMKWGCPRSSFTDSLAPLQLIFYEALDSHVELTPAVSTFHGACCEAGEGPELAPASGTRNVDEPINASRCHVNPFGTCRNCAGIIRTPRWVRGSLRSIRILRRRYDIIRGSSCESRVLKQATVQSLFALSDDGPPFEAILGAKTCRPSPYR